MLFLFLPKRFLTDRDDDDSSYRTTRSKVSRLIWSTRHIGTISILYSVKRQGGLHSMFKLYRGVRPSGMESSVPSPPTTRTVDYRLTRSMSKVFRSKRSPEEVCPLPPALSALSLTRRRSSYAKQLLNIVQWGYKSAGEIPIIIGETGIPFDTNSRSAFSDGDWSAQERQLDAVCCAMERNMVGFKFVFLFPFFYSR